MNIVIVDDNPVNLIVIEKILKSAGYNNLIKASSAVELLKMLETEPSSGLSLDLILMDMMMPEIDGIEATKRIQLMERFKDIPIIIITAMGDSIKLAEALEAGAIDYVMKPVNKIELIARIRVALRLKYEKDWHKENEKRIRTELELAKKVQSSVLSLPMHTETIDITASYNPSYELAGELYTWYKIDDHRYGIILLDIMGHGISSSLVCMFISSVLQDLITRYVSPELVIAELNRYMNQLNKNGTGMNYYFTAIYLLIDTESKTIDYVNAGHPAGLLLEEGQPPVRLNLGTCAVGFFDQMEIHQGTIDYKKDFRLFLYTDGLLEAIEVDEEESEETLLRFLQRTGGEPDVEKIMDELLPMEIRQQQQDDICMVLIAGK